MIFDFLNIFKGFDSRQWQGNLQIGKRERFQYSIFNQKGFAGIDSKITVQLSALTFSRVLINTAVRMVYPFLPAFSRALGVPVESLVLLVSARSALTISAPLFGGLSDRFGEQNVLYGALGIFLLGMSIVVILPGFWSFVAVILLVTISKIIFDPAAYSFLGARIPYSRRGFFVGIYEISWSVSFFIGMPLIGWLMTFETDIAWLFPFIVLGVLGVFSLAAFWRVLPKYSKETSQKQVSKASRSKWKTFLTDFHVLAMLSIGLLLCMAQENVLVILGIWLEKDFGLTLTALGLSSLVIGIAELAAEGGVIGLIDRWGKRSTILYGVFFSIFAYGMLPLIASSVTGALIALFLVFFAFEFTFVATLPLVTELVPNARSQVISLYIALQWGGRSLGALLGGYLFDFGILWNGILGAALNLTAFAILWIWVKEESKWQNN